MLCDVHILGICLQRAVGDTSQSIFGFAESIGALALLVIVYTIVGTQYQFRIYVAPGQLRTVTFLMIGVIGVGSLLKEVWIAEGWYVVPVPYMTQSVVEGLFGLAFLLIAMLWIFVAFIKPPRFSRWNYKRYSQRMVQIVLRGSDDELSDIAFELGKSADAIVKNYWKSATSNLARKAEAQKENRGRVTIGGYASDLLLLLGNRKLCRHIVASSPITAILFFDSASKHKAYDIPMAQFAKNISTEAILNTDSILYHEDDGFHSGLLGYLKRFSNAVYGDYRLVESLGSQFGSPLDIDYRIVFSWKAEQLKAYTRAVLITFDGWLGGGHWRQHSYALHRAFGNVEKSCHDVYKIEKAPEVDPDITERLRIVVEFIDKVVQAIEKQGDVAPRTMRPSKRRHKWDIYDRVAEMMSKVIFSVTSVKSSEFITWDIQYGTVWSQIFGHHDDSKARRIILFKLRRMIFDEILKMDRFINYKSARYIGICLNVLGVKFPEKGTRRDAEFALQVSVISWVKKNYLILRKENSDIAEACLIGTITFDEKKNQLVKTYEKGISKESPQNRLQLTD